MESGNEVFYGLKCDFFLLLENVLFFVEVENPIGLLTELNGEIRFM